MKLKNVLIVVKDIEKSRQFYHDLFGLELVLDNDGNMILTEGLVLQEEKYWKEFLGRDIIPENNYSELYFEEPDIEGFMSDETMSFMPWTDGFSRGLYLAGIEVYEDTAVPDGWVKWVMPARKYLVTEVQPENYGEIFKYVINSLIPELGMKLAGAVCDFTEPATGQNKLFFPVE